MMSGVTARAGQVLLAFAETVLFCLGIKMFWALILQVAPLVVQPLPSASAYLACLGFIVLLAMLCLTFIVFIVLALCCAIQTVVFLYEATIGQNHG